MRQEDFDWLLEDAQKRSAPNERQIAANAVLQLWRQSGSPPDYLARVKRIGAIHAEVAKAIDEWTRPLSKERELQREIRENKRRNDEAARHQSWRDFADRLRADPDQLRAIEPPTDKGVDSRLYHLWLLLSLHKSRYSVDNLTSLEPLFGRAVVAALGDAFIAFWRNWSPRLQSERPVTAADLIGIVGVTLEAAVCSNWATMLTHDEAVRAATYATLEINGFPTWLAGLARAQPDAVRDVIMRALLAELKSNRGSAPPSILSDIAHADNAIASLVAEHIFEYLRRNNELPFSRLSAILRILRTGFHDSGALTSLLRDRFTVASVVHEQAIYLASLFELDPAQAISILDQKLGALPPGNQTELALAVLPRLFGDRWRESKLRPREIPFFCLERLVLIAFNTIRVDEDNDRPPGVVYSPDERDDAESARSVLFSAFIDTPGLATFDAIHRLRKAPGFPIDRTRMMQFARHRAEKDSEFEAWRSADVCAFESDFLTAPRNPRDLQKLALRRLVDIQYDLEHSDYAQASTVARLPNEVDVQNWMADRLRASQGRCYSVEREPHVAEEKEPDIRFRAKESDANVPMEIKVADSWSLTELENALQVQLVGRYMRDRHNRYGILLLVHQKVRPKGWKTSTGAWFTFEEVVEYLRQRARLIASKEPCAPQAEIAVIDVSANS